MVKSDWIVNQINIHKSNILGSSDQSRKYEAISNNKKKVKVKVTRR